MFKKIKSAGKKAVSIEEGHKSSLEPANEKDPRARLESEEERRERRRAERDGKGEFSIYILYFILYCIFCRMVVAVGGGCFMYKDFIVILLLLVVVDRMCKSLRAGAM